MTKYLISTHDIKIKMKICQLNHDLSRRKRDSSRTVPAAFPS
jgi:hypothetical protein